MHFQQLMIFLPPLLVAFQQVFDRCFFFGGTLTVDILPQTIINILCIHTIEFNLDLLLLQQNIFPFYLLTWSWPGEGEPSPYLVPILISARSLQDFVHF